MRSVFTKFCDTASPYVDSSLVLLVLMSFADYGVDKYDIGTGFGHFGIAVEDVSTCAWISFLRLIVTGLYCMTCPSEYSCLGKVKLPHAVSWYSVAYVTKL